MKIFNIPDTESDAVENPISHLDTDMHPSVKKSGPNKKIPKLPPEQQLEELVNGMGVIKRMLYQKQVGKMNAETAMEIARVYNNALLEVTVQDITLAVDQEKKRIFLAYLKSNGEMHRELQRMEAEIRTEMSREVIRLDELATGVFDTANKTVQRMRGNKLISDAGEKFFYARYAQLVETLYKDNIVNLNMMISAHRELLRRTLTLFLSKLKSSGVI